MPEQWNKTNAWTIPEYMVIISLILNFFLNILNDFTYEWLKYSQHATNIFRCSSLQLAFYLSIIQSYICSNISYWLQTYSLVQ